jgi:hypothetical protein
MDEYTPEELDTLIEEALKIEPMRRAPLTLHRRVLERVHVAALCEQEKIRFRYSMLGMAVAFLAVVAGAVLMVSLTNLWGVMNYGVPGGKGQFDYYATSMFISWTRYGGAYSMILSILGAGIAVLLGLLPPRKDKWSH